MDRSSSRPRRAEGLEVNEVPDGLIVVQPSVNRVHQLNRTAAAVFAFCTGAHAATEIATRVQELYGLPEAPEGEVERCLEEFRREGLVR